MLLTPSQQTDAQVTALQCLLDARDIRVWEPCDCDGQIRHNNGGNYHAILAVRLDGGTVYRAETYTGDYGPPLDWQPVSWGAAVEEIAARAAEGWTVRPSAG